MEAGGGVDDLAFAESSTQQSDQSRVYLGDGLHFDLLELNYGKLLEMGFFLPSNTFWGVAKLQVLGKNF